MKYFNWFTFCQLSICSIITLNVISASKGGNDGLETSVMATQTCILVMFFFP